jgi:hypothetical protein
MSRDKRGAAFAGGRVNVLGSHGGGPLRAPARKFNIGFFATIGRKSTMV